MHQTHTPTYHIPRVDVKGDEGDDLGAIPGGQLAQHELDERGEAGVADLSECWLDRYEGLRRLI